MTDGVNTTISWKVRAALSLLYSRVEVLQNFLEQRVDHPGELVLDTDGNGFRKFLQNTIVCSRNAQESGSGYSQTAFLSLSEVVAQAVERVKRRNESKNVLVFGWKCMSDNAKSQVSTSLNYEYSDPNLSTSALLSRYWRTLHLRVGDALLIHLLESRAIFSLCSPPSCYVQLTGVATYELCEGSRSVAPCSFPDAGSRFRARKRACAAEMPVTASGPPTKQRKIEPESESHTMGATVKRHTSALSQVGTGIPAVCTTQSDTVMVRKRTKMMAGAAPSCRGRRFQPVGGCTPGNSVSQRDKAYDCAKVIHRLPAFYSKRLVEGWPVSSVLHRRRAPVAKNLASDIMKLDVGGSNPHITDLQLRITETRLSSILEKLLAKHRTCHMAHIVQHYAPRFTDQSARVETSQQQLLSHFHPPDKIFQFLRCVLKKIVPVELFGSLHNEKQFLKFVKHVVFAGRYDKLSLGSLMSRVRVRDVAWLPRKLNHVAKQAAVARAYLWLMQQFILVLLKSYFYVTESTQYRNRLIYYRKSTWIRVQDKAVSELVQAGLLEPITQHQVSSKLSDGQCLGVAGVRFLPKTSSVRPVVKLSQCVDTGSYNGRAVNKQLQTTLQALVFETARRPELLGSSTFGQQGIHKSLRQFIANRRRRNDQRPLFIVKTDIKNCYDSIVKEKLMEIVTNILKQNGVNREYMVRRYATLQLARGRLWRRFQRDVTTLEEFEPNFNKFVRKTTKEKKLRNTIFIDQVNYMRETSERMLEKIAKHLNECVVKIGRKFYVRRRGITQGSILSAMFCNCFYGDMENKNMAISIDELLMRQSDDFLFMTPNLEKARNVLTLLLSGIKEYNFTVNKERKTLVNFDVADEKIARLPAHALFPWCGFLINPDTLEIMVDYTRYAGLKVSDFMTFDLSMHQGQALKDKILHSLCQKNKVMFLDPTINSDATLLCSVRSLFQLCALQFVAYAKKLQNTNANHSPAFFLDVIRELPVALACQIWREFEGSRSSAVLDRQQLRYSCFSAFCEVLSPHRGQFHKVLTGLSRDVKNLETATHVTLTGDAGILKLQV